MFFDDDELGPLKKKAILRVPPPTPETGWRPPSEFPNLSAAVVLSVDTEGRERDWAHGPGWARGKSDLCGFSIGARDRQGNTGQWYFPVEHHVEPEYNLDKTKCLSWLRDQMATPSIPKVGANLIFDVGTLACNGVDVQGPCYDVQFAEAILNTDELVNLDHLGQKYLDEGKTGNALYEWCALAYGGKPTAIQRENIWRASPRLVGPYGEQDAAMPIRILDQQWPLLQAEGLLHIFEMECQLIPLLVAMRLQGVRVDLLAAEKLYDELQIAIAEKYAELRAMVPVKFDTVNSPGDVARIFDHCGVDYPRTEAGAPSFRKDWLKNLDHPVADKLVEIREHEKLSSTFVRNYVLEGHTNGRLHCQFHPLKGDDDGAKTGRFSSSDPNLQNIPIRSKIGKLLRAAFVPEVGHIAWEKDDYSQIEYRDLAHFAVDKGDGSADALRQKYINDPTTDYHASTIENVKALTGMEIERRPIKNMNFGLIYGMSQKKLIRQNGFTPAQGKLVFEAYHRGNPYVRPTMAAAAAEMQALGYITTVLGRRTRFNTWEPIFTGQGAAREMPLPYEWAIRRWGSRIKRAGEHKAINYRLQGSAAEQIKMGMVKCWNAGIYHVIGVPRIQVHDELGFSVIDDSPVQREAYAEMRRILETSITLRIPIKVDSKRGPNWGAID